MKQYIVRGIWNITYLAKDKQDAFDSASKMIQSLNNPNIKIYVQEVSEGSILKEESKDSNRTHDTEEEDSVDKEYDVTIERVIHSTVTATSEKEAREYALQGDGDEIPDGSEVVDVRLSSFQQRRNNGR